MSTTLSDGRWRLEATTARLKVGGLQARIDLLRPTSGLHDFTGADGSVLGVALEVGDVEELSLSETYVRGNDLVATYPETSRRPFRMQLYWHAVDERTIELQASVNTGLLDARPALDVVTALDDGEWYELESGLFLFRSTTTTAWSYCEASHPKNEATSQVVLSAGRSRLVHRLFDRPLEKGVILRSRVRGALVPREGDDVAAKQMHREFVASEPPLTT
jgi:hypothetical protein